MLVIRNELFTQNVHKYENYFKLIILYINTILDDFIYMTFYDSQI